MELFDSDDVGDYWSSDYEWPLGPDGWEGMDLPDLDQNDRMWQAEDRHERLHARGLCRGSVWCR